WPSASTPRTTARWRDGYFLMRSGPFAGTLYSDSRSTPFQVQVPTPLISAVRSILGLMLASRTKATHSSPVFLSQAIVLSATVSLLILVTSAFHCSFVTIRWTFL